MKALFHGEYGYMYLFLSFYYKLSYGVVKCWFFDEKVWNCRELVE